MLARMAMGRSIVRTGMGLAVIGDELHGGPGSRRGYQYTPGQTAPVRPATPQDDLAAQLLRLAQLHARGVLTDEEFAAAKRKALRI